MTDFYKQKKALDELSSIYLKLDEISADTALAASKKADVERGKAAVAGDKERAKEKAGQAARLYKKQADKRLNRESVSNWREDPSLKEVLLLDASVDPIKNPDEQEKEIKEKNVKNKIVIDPDVKLEQKVAEGMTTAALEQCPKCGKSHDGDCVEEEVADEYLKTVAQVKKAENEADKKRWQVEESILWDRVARDLSRLHEGTGIKYKVIPFEEGYQRNPEKGEAEERKAEKRRKESGGMPPRGDKRREAFEKWYAANVR
jgi:hypothetical protein